MYTNINNTLIINDLPTIATLSCLGLTHIATDRQRDEVSFIYKKTQRIVNTIEKVQQGRIKVDPLIFSSHLKKIKTIIYQNIIY